MSACVFGSTATVRVLLEHGASVDLCDEVRDSSTCTHILNDHLLLSHSLYRMGGQILFMQVLEVARR